MALPTGKIFREGIASQKVKSLQGIIHSGEMEFLTYFMGSEWTTRVSNKSLPLTRFTLLQEKNSNSNNSNCKMPTGDVANIK